MLRGACGFYLAAAIALPVLGGSNAAEAGPSGLSDPGRQVTAPAAFTEACDRYAWLCAEPVRARPALSHAEAAKIARRVNDEVNRQIEQVPDPILTGAADHWSLPIGNRGDCEDIVLEKLLRLLAAGVHPSRLSFSIVLDWNGDNHAVLLFEAPEGVIVLDSLTDAVRTPVDSGYRFLARQSVDDRRSWQLYDPQPAAATKSAALDEEISRSEPVFFGAR